MNTAVKDILFIIDNYLNREKVKTFHPSELRELLQSQKIQESHIQQIIFLAEDDAVHLERIAIERKENIHKIYIAWGVFLFGIAVIVYFLFMQAFIFWPLVFLGIGLYLGFGARRQLHMLRSEEQIIRRKRHERIDEWLAAKSV